MSHISPREFAERLAADLVRSEVRLVGCYLHGSAALGGWNPARSDVDLLVVVDGAPPTTQVLTATILGCATGCPGTGLECSVVTADAARHPAPPWPFVLHVATAGGTTIVDGATTDGDPDLVAHYAVTRTHGIAVHGPPPADAFGEVPRRDLLTYLHDELDWALTHATEEYAVLNALRARRYATDDALLSKIQAAEDARSDATLPESLIARSLEAQRGDGTTTALPGLEAGDLVRETQTLLRAAVAIETP